MSRFNTAEKLNVGIELCGYKAKITHVWTRQAFPPWHPEDQLLACIEFDEPRPQAIISTAVAIPVKEYSRDELLRVVKEEGGKQLAQTLARAREESEKTTRQRQRQEELDAAAKKAEEVLKG
jgi:hypothetical protein